MFPTSKTSADRLYHRFLVAASAAFIAGCGVQPEDEITACANVRCAAGTCRLVDGTPTCVCSPVEVVQGLECAVFQSRPAPEPDDFGDDFATAAKLPLEQLVWGTIDYRSGPANDVDMFWIQTTPGQAYLVRYSGYTIEVLHPDGTVAPQVTRWWPGEYGARATADRMYVRVSGPVSARYFLSASLIADDAPNTHDGAAPALEGTHTNNFEVNDDQDVFTFVAAPDSAFTVEVQDRYSYAPTRVDIEAPDGTVLASGNGAAGVRDQSGPLFIRMVTTAGGGFYDWSFQRAPRDDYPDAASLAAPMTLPLSVQGRLEASNDADAFSFELPRDHAVTVSCVAFLPSTCQVDILDAAGALVAENPNKKTIQLAAGTYVALVRGIGKYDLRLDWYDDYPTPSSLRVEPSVITGEIDYEDDRDGVWLIVTRNHYYRATCTSSTGTCTAVPGNLLRNGSEFRAMSGIEAIPIEVSGTIGPYELNLEDLGYDAEPGLEEGWEILLGFPSTLSGTFEVGWDSDCFIFNFGAGTYTFDQTAGDPMQIRLDGSVSTLPATISFAPQPATSYPVCFAPAPWFTDGVRGSAGPYAVTMTSP